MAKWIPDWTDVDSNPHSIAAREVHTSHNESYNNLSGNPQFNVVLAVPWNDRYLAIQQLLGRPCIWPYDTPFNLADLSDLQKVVVASSVQIINDTSRYTTDMDGEVINYAENALLQITYMPRMGMYAEITVKSDGTTPLGAGKNQDIFLSEIEVPRFEFIPQSPKLFAWGGTTTTLPSLPLVPLSPNETPSKNNSEVTLVRTIEGWCGIFDIQPFVNTTHSQSYTSSIVRKTYAANTLMLRSYNLERGYYHRSYRELGSNPGTVNEFFDFGNLPCFKLTLNYEYKASGWQRFFRADAESGQTGLYYIRYNQDPHDIYTPFGPKHHGVFFDV